MLDVHTLGAGGGSIAWIDSGGLLKVGPRSAGADPGPGLLRPGGTSPTVTDANVVLRRARAGSTCWAAAWRIDAAVAPSARDARPGRAARPRRAADGAGHPVGSSTPTWRGPSASSPCKRGHDPRDFALMAFGGAGPLHAAQLARELGSACWCRPIPGSSAPWACCRPTCGTLYLRSAVGSPVFLSGCRDQRISPSCGGARSTTSSEEGLDQKALRLKQQFDLRYPHQGYTSRSTARTARSRTRTSRPVKPAFDELHRHTYGAALPRRMRSS